MKKMFRIHLITVIGVVSAFSSCSKKEVTTNDTPAPETAAAPPHPATNKHTVSLDTPVSFNEHIQPILSANCYHCHGPDSGSRFPEDEPYRLDNIEGAFEVRKNGKANIIKGDPDNSYLITLMESKDPDKVMPLHPSKSPHGKTMDPADIALVRRWVKEGAVFEDHWAYISPKKAELPKTKNTSWARNEVDHFILNKLEAKGLQPNSDEDKSRLLRRLNFDLTGLPPTIEEIKAFTSDTRDFEIVYKEKVDALLKTDAYAENFARHWLDVARYSDTHGIHIDNYRSIWPYRDWVIKAFQKNMKFDQFTQEQVAGDMMPNATLDQKVASGYNRCLPTTGEGGAIPEEYEAIYAQDRVNATSAAWLGLTAGCAACHDHKFDAISTKENYQLTAFFRNTTMTALDRNDGNHPPNILIPIMKDRDRYKAIPAELAVQEKQKKDYRSANDPAFLQWLEKQKNAAALIAPALAGNTVNLLLNDKTKGINHPTHTSLSPLTWEPGLSGDAVKFTNNNAISLGNTGDFENNQAFSFGAWVKVPKDSVAGIIAKMDNKNNYRGYDLYTQNGNLVVHLINHFPNNYIKVTSRKKFPPNEWMHVMVTYNGKKRPNGIKIYVNGKEETFNVNGNKLNKTIKTTAPLLLGSRHGGNPFKNGLLQHFQLYNRQLAAHEAVRISTEGNINALVKNTKSGAKPDPQQLNKLRDYFFAHKSPESLKIQEKINQINNEKRQIEHRGARTLIMDVRPNKKPTAHILIRGQYTQKDKEVLSPNTPASLPPMTKDMPKNRLGLAKWLTDPANPLPARVTVNRYWYYLFGTGIVETNDDFGVMGARPTHPKLLDWLAVDFVENNWDLHHLLRKMVMSSTYRQSAVISKEKAEADPLNKYYARAPRYRLDAEQIRDLALSSSQLLHPEIGGPSVKPYQPINIWESVAMKGSNTRIYKQDTGNKLYRRSIYTFMKRTAPHPTMEILNAATREEACVKRDITNTPLQAFVIMNDPQFVESSRQLAAQTLQKASTTEERIDYISLSILSRAMTEPEVNIVKDTLNKVKATFTAKPEEAKKLISVGESKAPANLDPTELASWSIIASQVLNMDEALNK